MQTTLLQPVTVAGTGLHSGAPARVTLRDAPAGSGLRFRRVSEGRESLIPATWDRVEVSPLNTRIVGEGGLSVSTIEHLMAALAGTGVHNALIEIDGPEVPILDGSALPWVEAILAAGVATLDAPLEAIEVLEPVEVRSGAAVARLEPGAGFSMEFAIDFPDAAIGHQERRLDLGGAAFLRELADSRTFCREADVEAMRARGLALGGTYLNAVVVDGARVLTPGGLRHPDEAVRHKMLDAVGDLATAGAPILGRYVGLRAGHAMTNRLLRELFARPEAWRRVPCDAGLRARLPGAGPLRARRADLPAVA
ncbi:UDP-3-O-acyl-N-acetylglucosamine deacetylase [Rubellimicrobium aerolatum]|uniref:UDP-3-O-acyl-N-acetylglucosamine deacetylase n=1 Tax=Rubellimicrobium aerolatum TaxID=490979 RepID=A0ABW0S7J1_9RHOB|nr:UDP-3-O-[3-hydroxymyristoyl] N-acetylglucosamine deacetylase [Rubellimicrobium aerolatum]